METHPLLSVPARGRPRKRLLLWVGLIILAVVGVIAYVLLNQHKCYSVGQVWQHARALRGTRICVQGKAVTQVSFTALLCDPPTCDCNQSSGYLELISEDKVVHNPKVSLVDSITISPSLNTPMCSGNQCTLTCSPFDPRAADRFQMVGTLSVSFLADGRLLGLQLTDLDIPASRELVNGNWQPIPTGVFTGHP